MIGFPELESLNDITIVVCCGVFVVFTIIRVLTCYVAIFASSFVKSATLTQLAPFQRNIFLFAKLDTLTSLFISEDIVLLIHFDDDELYINKLLFDKLDKVTSVEFPIERIDIYVGVTFIQTAPLYCNTWHLYHLIMLK